MFALFKSRPKLSELISNEYVDIHSHLLPGIDDGAQTIDDSKSILEAMQSLGFKQVITTPHTIKTVWNNTKQGIENTYEYTKQELEELTNKLHLSVASEYMMDENFVELFKSEKLLTLKDNYVLVEMSYLNPPIQLFEIIFELQLEGYKPILAHPERYSFYHTKPHEYDKLKKAGCLFQMNLLSSVGYYSKEVAQTADYLLNNELIDFVGSDIHHQHHIAAFQNKIIIKNQKELEKVIAKNKFFTK